MKREFADKILNETEAGYDLMAEKFSETRKHFWRGLEFIKDYVKDGDKILDYGCGNGRLLELLWNKKIDYTGIDVSRKLINIAKSKYPGRNFYKTFGVQKLPYPDNYFNTVYSIAVFHHLPSRELRKKTAEELHRIAKPEGHVIVTVWNLWQGKYLKNIIINYINKLIYGCKLDWNDCYISFKDNKGNVFNRYHHAFTKKELNEIFSGVGFDVRLAKRIKRRNIILIGRK